MKDLKGVVKDVERDLLINIVLSVRHKRMTKAQAKKLSKSYLTSFPFNDFDSLFESLKNLSKSSREARKVYVKYAQDYYDSKDKVTLSEMRFYLNKKDLNNAILAGRRIK
jgi:hypothetical protein